MAEFADLIEGGPDGGYDEPIPQAPPKDNAEIARRMSGWADIGQRVQNSPALQQALIMFGARMMQPTQPGDTYLGQTGRALSYASATGSLVQGDLDQQVQDTETHRAGLDLAQARTESSRAHARASDQQARASRSETRRAEERHPQELQKSKDDLATARQAFEKANIELLFIRAKVEAGLATPAEANRMHQLEILKREAETKLTNAKATHETAAAGYYNTGAGKADPVAKEKFLLEQLKLAEPGLTEQEYAAKIVKGMGSGKSDRIRGLIAMVENSLPNTPEQQAAMRELEAELSIKKSAAPAKADGKEAKVEPTRRRMTEEEKAAAKEFRKLQAEEDARLKKQ